MDHLCIPNAMRDLLSSLTFNSSFTSLQSNTLGNITSWRLCCMLTHKVSDGTFRTWGFQRWSCMETSSILSSSPSGWVHYQLLWGPKQCRYKGRQWKWPTCKYIPWSWCSYCSSSLPRFPPESKGLHSKRMAVWVGSRGKEQAAPGQTVIREVAQFPKYLHSLGTPLQSKGGA